MADDNLPVMANRGQTPYVPTGYESLGQSVQRKRRIADALMQQGLAGPREGARSWAQLLGSLAQTWAGKSIQKEADKEEAENQQKQRQEAMAANAAFEADAASGLGAKELLTKYAANPWVQARLKPYETAYSELMKNQAEFAAPMEMLGPDGEFSTVQINKAGETRQLPGGFALPPKMEIVNGVAIAPSRMKAGQVAPQPAMDPVVVGPNGKPMVNPLALNAKTQIATAGAPRVSVETKVNTANMSDAAVKQLETSLTAAKTGITTLQTAARMQEALDKGVASTGPFSNFKNFLDRVLGTNKEGVKERRILEQGFNQLTLAARGYLEGQGAVSNFEAESVQKAAGGDINELTPEEIQAILDVARRSAETSIDNHNTMLDNAAGMEGSGQYLPMFQLPDGYRKTTYESPAKTNAKVKAPVPVKKQGLPPKGATSTSNPPSPYRARYPKPVGN